MDYVCSWRTSYFKPRNRAQLDRFLKRWGLEPLAIEQTDDETELVALGQERVEGMPGLPPGHHRDDCWIYHEPDFLMELAAQIDPAWAVEVREIGQEKLRYLIATVWTLAHRRVVTERSLTGIEPHEAEGLSYTSNEY